MRMTIEEIIQGLKSPYPVTRANAIEVVDVLLRYYEQRLKSDMVAMLTDIQLEMNSFKKDVSSLDPMDGDGATYREYEARNRLIDKMKSFVEEKINALKENEDGQE